MNIEGFIYLLVIVPFIFFINHSWKNKYEHTFAVCAMFKDEAPYLREWIEYHHHVLGATKFYLYNNDSTDNYEEILEPYTKKGIVEIIDWESCEKNALNGYNCISWDRYQIGAYNDCLKNRALGKARWVAVCDIDEYIVPVGKSRTFKALLKEFSLKSLLKRMKRPFRKKRH